MSIINLMKIVVLVTILCALPCYSMEYPQYPANEIPNITPPLTKYLLPVDSQLNRNNSNTSSITEQSGLHVFNAASYPNGPIILRLIRRGENNCSEPNMYLRLIYLNTTAMVINISITDPIITIPTFNFCPISTNPPRDMIRIFPLSYNHTMIAFLRNLTGSPETHEEIGMFIDWNGKVMQ